MLSFSYEPKGITFKITSTVLPTQGNPGLATANKVLFLHMLALLGAQEWIITSVRPHCC